MKLYCTGKCPVKNIVRYARVIAGNCTTSLKVVSSEDKGGTKIAPIVGYWPRTEAMDVNFCDRGSSSCFYHIFVSVGYCPINSWNNKGRSTSNAALIVSAHYIICI